MRNAYIIEINDEAVGVVARDGGGFRFHAALQTFNRLDGRLFPSLRQASRAARTLMSGGDRSDHLSSREARDRRDE